MNKLFLFTLLTLISVTKYVACGTKPQVDKTTPTSAAPCDSKLWARTYGAMARFGQLKRNPTSLYDRENLDHRCVFDVKAVVENVASQPDGDMKLWLIVDDANFAYNGAQPPYVPLKKSEFYPAGEFTPNGKKRRVVAEIVCAAPKQRRGSGIDPKTNLPWKLPGEMSPVTDSQNDGAVIACRDYNNAVYIPRVLRLPNGQVVLEEVYVTGELVTDRGPKLNPDWKEPVPGGPPPTVPKYIPGHGHVEIHPVTSIRK